MRTERRPGVAQRRRAGRSQAALGGVPWAAEAGRRPQARKRPRRAAADWQHWQARVTDVTNHRRSAARRAQLRQLLPRLLTRSSTSAGRASGGSRDPDALAAEGAASRPGTSPTQYILHQACRPPTPKPGSARRRPDLSLDGARARPDYLYQFLKTFYLDPRARLAPTTCGCRRTAMPGVLSELEGVKRAVFKDRDESVTAASCSHRAVFDHFGSRSRPGASRAAECA